MGAPMTALGEFITRLAVVVVLGLVFGAVLGLAASLVSRIVG
jgi:hypothetical protein